MNKCCENDVWFITKLIEALRDRSRDRGRRWLVEPSWSAVFNTGPGYIGGGTEVSPGSGGCAEKYTGEYCLNGPTIVGQDHNGECEGEPDPPPGQ